MMGSKIRGAALGNASLMAPMAASLKAISLESTPWEAP